VSNETSFEREFISKICLVYFDDIIIFGKNFEEMFQNLKRVLSRLWEVNLKVNPKKCILFRQKVKYLEHVILSEGISTDDDKIAAVNNQFRKVKNIYEAF